jgi:hypothetical protein
MEEPILEKLPLVASNMASSGIDNLLYPDYLAGTWDVVQTLTQVQAPLGVQFLNPDRATAERSLAEAQSKLNQPVSLQLRYLPTKWGTAEDRVFNTANRLNAFAGRTVVASAEYADVRSSNRDAVLRQGGAAADPLTTVFIRFKGPAAQKIFVTSHASLDCKAQPQPAQSDPSTTCGCWVASESQRSIFALTNESPAPPIFTDSEVMYEFHVPDCSPSPASAGSRKPDRVQGRLRIASYLNPMDELYFDARNRAVSLQDYTLDMRRVSLP